MGWADYCSRLEMRGVVATEAMIRFALKMKRLPTPKVDLSRRYIFSDEDVEKAVQYFSTRNSRGRRQLATA